MTDSTWSTKPVNGDWNDATNWHPGHVPTGTAKLGASDQTSLRFAKQGATVKAIVFTEDAPHYTIHFGQSKSPSLTIDGAGVKNESSSHPTFVVASTSSGYEDAQLRFTGSATAGHGVLYVTGPATPSGFGGGVIGFLDKSNAGSSSFLVTTGAAKPPQHSTVGGEVSFSHHASASSASFLIYGTTGTDGDTFGNVVFHDESTADHGMFTNVGGTVANGDGGNTQFYDGATAAHGLFHNRGGTIAKSNGGDVAFDGSANGGHGAFHNYAAPIAAAYGGVTSFNNNPPEVTKGGASAGDGEYFNYGATEGKEGGGGHTEFSAKHGSPTGANGQFHNYGSAVEGNSSAGHTVFSITLPTSYFPTAGKATFRNYGARSAKGAGGFTQFAIYGEGKAGNHVPTAGEAVFHNEGGASAGAAGGYTEFSGASTAGNATLIAYAGSSGGYGGRVVFYDEATGGAASVTLHGDGELAIGDHTGGLTIGTLDARHGGTISTQLGTTTTTLTLSSKLILDRGKVKLSFKAGPGFKLHTAYPILVAPNLSDASHEQFTGGSIDGAKPSFAISGNTLTVSFAH